MIELMRPLPSPSRALSATRVAAGAIPARVPCGVVAVAGDDAGDVRAVAPVVVAGGAAVDEVDELGDPLGGAAGVAQVVVVRRDARVDHRDADALAVEAHQGLDGLGADGNRLAADQRLDRAVEVDPLDVAAAGQLTEQPLGHPRRAAAHPRQSAIRPAALGANRLVGVAVVGELDDDRQVVVVALDVAQERVELGLVRAPRPLLPLRGRVVGEGADGEANESGRGRAGDEDRGRCWSGRRRARREGVSCRSTAQGRCQDCGCDHETGAIGGIAEEFDAIVRCPLHADSHASRRSLGQDDLARPETAAARSSRQIAR